VRLLKRVAALPEQLWLKALLAQILELVEVDLEFALVPAQLAPERAEMVEAARHQGLEPDAGLFIRLVELHRQIHIADIERAAGVGAEDPDLAHPKQVGALPPTTLASRPSTPFVASDRFTEPDYCAAHDGPGASRWPGSHSRRPFSSGA